MATYHGLTRAEDDDIERVLFSAEAIAARVQELGAQIGRDYDGRRPLIVGIITGARLSVLQPQRAG
jgi:hypoxanthine-guanine phosphoribosyltransferase